MTESTDPREIDGFQEDDNVLPRDPICVRSGQEVEWDGQLIYLEHGEPIAWEYKQFATEAVAVETHYGHYKNSGPFTHWLEVTKRIDIHRPWWRRVQGFITRKL